MPEVVGYTWRHWVMSADRIAALRARAAAAAAAARERESARAGAQAGVGGGAPASQAGGAGGGAPDLAEEARLRLHWEHKVQEVCAAFKFPSKVMVCAVTYFKRFYLSHSILDYHPKHILCTCIYLACKVEENHVSATQFGIGLNDENVMGHVLKHELIVLEALRFELIVRGPRRPMLAALASLGGGLWPPDSAAKGRVTRAANRRADRAMLTDAVLQFPPSVVAVAAVRHGARAVAEEGGPDVGGADEAIAAMVEAAASAGEYAGGAAALAARMDECDALIDAQDVALDKDDIVELERRRKEYRNPLYNPESAQYKEAAAEKEARRKKAKRSKASKSVSKSVSLDDFKDVADADAGTKRVPMQVDAADDGGDFLKRRKSDDGRPVPCSLAS